MAKTHESRLAKDIAKAFNLPHASVLEVIRNNRDTGQKPSAPKLSALASELKGIIDASEVPVVGIDSSQIYNWGVSFLHEGREFFMYEAHYLDSSYDILIEFVDSPAEVVYKAPAQADIGDHIWDFMNTTRNAIWRLRHTHGTQELNQAYKELLDISHEQEENSPATVVLLTIDSDEGVLTSAHKSLQGAQAFKLEYFKESWESEMGPLPTSPQEVEQTWLSYKDGIAKCDTVLLQD